jgi:hypothetical protein
MDEAIYLFRRGPLVQQPVYALTLADTVVWDKQDRRASTQTALFIGR